MRMFARTAFVAFAMTVAEMIGTAECARGAMMITEWMYSGTGGEYVEFTNVGAAPIDMAGWSYDDSDRAAGSVDLSSFGVVQSGESVILAEGSAETFRSDWGLNAATKIVGGSIHNLARNDEINLFDASMALADRLTYGDQNFPGTIRTQDFSGNPNTLAALGGNDPSQWSLASAGDSYGSFASSNGDVGNPGNFMIPEPRAFILFVLGVAGMFASFGRGRRRKATSAQ